MSELPLNIQRLIGKYEPIETEGLTLYPIKVESYYEFLVAKQALDFMQQSLPVKLMSIPLLEAYFKLDTGQVEGREPSGLFMSAILALSLALRLKPTGTIEEQIKQFQIIQDPKDPTRLKHLRCVKSGEEIITITPVQFQKLRPIIAAQNGIELYSDMANPELVQAEQDLANAKAPNLDMSIEALVSAAALIAKVEEKEIYEWPILKMNRRLESAKRIIDYIICGIGESQGTSWKGGNPFPHPWFERKTESNGGLMALDKFANGQGLKAIQDAEISNP